MKFSPVVLLVALVGAAAASPEPTQVPKLERRQSVDFSSLLSLATANPASAAVAASSYLTNPGLLSELNSFTSANPQAASSILQQATGIVGTAAATSLLSVAQQATSSAGGSAASSASRASSTASSNNAVAARLGSGEAAHQLGYTALAMGTAALLGVFAL